MSKREVQIHDLWKRKIHASTIGETIALELILTTWTSSGNEFDDSDRGCYLTEIPGTDLRIAPPGGWHAMEITDMKATRAWRVIADKIDAMLVAHRG